MKSLIALAAVALAVAFSPVAEAGGRSKQVFRQVSRGHGQAQTFCAPQQVFVAPQRQVVYAQPQLFAYPAPQQVFLPQASPVYAAPQVQPQVVCIPAPQQQLLPQPQYQQGAQFQQQTVISGSLQAGMIPY